MNENLFQHLNILNENTHIPSGLNDDNEAECRKYESLIIEAGGIDLQILGIGANGHIGFNELAPPFIQKHMLLILPSPQEKRMPASFIV